MNPELVSALDEQMESVELLEDESPDVDIDEEDNHAVCNLGGLYNGVSMNVDPVVDQREVLPMTLSPPESGTIPLNNLEGVVTSNSGDLLVKCHGEKEPVGLASNVIAPEADRVDNAEARLAMARVLVDMTNHARERFGCSDSALSLPTELPSIPDRRMPMGNDGSDEQARCAGATTPPDYDRKDDEELWTVSTPKPSKMLSVCEQRAGDRSEDHPLAMVVTYKNTLAEVYQESSERAMPEYDTTCDGSPVSYRAYVVDPEHPDKYLAQLPEGQEYQDLQRDMASSAAEAQGCSLPDG